MFRQIQHAVLVDHPHIVKPFSGDAVSQQLFVGNVGEQERLWRRRNRGFDVHGHRDFLDHLAQFDQLGRSGGGMGLQLPAFRPAVGIVVAPNVAENHIVAGAVENDAQVEANAGRPEIGVLGVGQFMHAQSGLRRIGLQVKGRGLDRFLLLIGQPPEAGGKGVCDAKVHLCTSVRDLIVLAPRPIHNPPN